MDISEMLGIKEAGAAVVVIAGVAYGVSSGGLKDALSSDIKHVSEVTYEERADYMDGLVGEFSAAFDTYIVQTETYDYVGQSKFSASPTKATFVEVVAPEDAVPTGEFAGIKARMGEASFCATEEMTMFTENGWNYKFTLQDGRGRGLYTVTCQGQLPGGKNQAIG